jgi:hypothetical protein
VDFKPLKETISAQICLSLPGKDGSDKISDTYGSYEIQKISFL